MNRGAHRTGTIVLSVVMIVIGIALITESLSHGGVISPRGLLGLLFIAAGVLRLRLSRPNDGEPQG
jgi:hypothetical protein